MDAALLTRIFGNDQRWQGPCTVILDADATMQVIGADAIVGSGTKVYAPRVISGRLQADQVCWLADGSALVVMQSQRTRVSNSEEMVKQTVTIIDPRTVSAVEFQDVSPLAGLGLTPPTTRSQGSHPGIHPRPRV